MEELRNALERILNWIEKYEPERAFFLQPGLSLSEMEEKVRVLPFRLPQEFYELYQWRNGFIGKEVFQGLGGHDFHNLAFEIKQYFHLINYSKKCAAIDNNSYYEDYRNPQWFSLLGHDKEDYFIIGEPEQKQASPVFCFDYGDLDDFRPKLKYSSLTSMMLTIAKCYETSVYYWVEGKNGKYFGMNYQAAESIRRKYNPDSE